MPKENNPPSKEFMDIVCNRGAPVIECEFCGRIHYAPDTDLDFEEGELEELERKHKQNPEKYVRDSFSSDVSWGVLDGKQIVYDCPCNSASKYERFIWNHRHLIAEYLSLRAEKQEKQARENKNIADKVKKSI